MGMRPNNPCISLLIEPKLFVFFGEIHIIGLGFDYLSL